MTNALTLHVDNTERNYCKHGQVIVYSVKRIEDFCGFTQYRINFNDLTRDITGTLTTTDEDFFAGLLAAYDAGETKRLAPDVALELWRWFMANEKPAAKVCIVKDIDGEYRAPDVNNTEAGAYYTDDKDDAVATCKAEFLRKGFDVKCTFRTIGKNHEA